MNGQALRRTEAYTNTAFYGSYGAPHEVWYRFAGKQLGYVGNNGTLETDYASSIERRRTQPENGPFRFGSFTHANHVNFDLSGEPITSYDQGGSGGSYTARNGDTLASVAAQLWGDSSLWYKLAEANGMSGASALIEGQRITIPPGIVRSGHNASTLKPYDPLETAGDLSPSATASSLAARPPKRNNCGMFGQMLLVVVAVAVTALVAGPAAGLVSSKILGGAIAGAAGAIASQGVGLATGLQEKFSFKQVAMSAIGGAAGAGVGQIAKAGVAGSKLLTGIVKGAATSAISQTVAVVTGLQSKFDFAGVAAAGLAGGASAWTRGKLGNVGSAVRNALGSSASAIANAGVRSIANGSSFGDNLRAALPDVIGDTIGNMIADTVSGRLERRRGGIVVTGMSAGSAAAAFAVPGLSDFQLSGAALAAPGVTVSGAVEPVPGAGGGQTGRSADAPPPEGEQIVVTGDRARGGRVSAQDVARNAYSGARAARRSIANVPSHDGIAGGPATGHDFIGFFLDNMTRDLPGFFQQSEYQFFGPGAGDPANYVSYAERLIEQATDYQLRRMVLPVLNGWAGQGAFGEGWSAAAARVREVIAAREAQFNADWSQQLGDFGRAYVDIGSNANPILFGISTGSNIYNNGLGSIDPISLTTEIVGRRLRAVSESLEKIVPGFHRMDPRDIRFTQSTVTQRFSDGANTINSTADALRLGRISPDDVGAPMRVVFRDGRYWSLDNRRLAAFSAAGVDNVPVQVIRLDNRQIRQEWGMKFNPIAGQGRHAVVIENRHERPSATQILRQHGLIR